MTTNKLNFGCGKDIKSGYYNCDIEQAKGIDKCFNFNKFPYPYPDNFFDYIYSDNVIEHLDNIPRVFHELHRISKNNAQLRIIVPHYHSYGAYNDVTHTHYFSHLSFEPFYIPNTRGNYFIKEKFKLISLKLVPTRLGKLIFSPLRLPLSYVFGQIFQTIDITLKVTK